MPRQRHPGALTEGYTVKGGQNDLSRWEAFGGALKRPPPPAPMVPKPPDAPIVFGGFPDWCFNTCINSADCLMWGCLKDHGEPPRSSRSK